MMMDLKSIVLRNPSSDTLADTKQQHTYVLPHPRDDPKGFTTSLHAYLLAGKKTTATSSSQQLVCFLADNLYHLCHDLVDNGILDARNAPLILAKAVGRLVELGTTGGSDDIATDEDSM